MGLKEELNSINDAKLKRIADALLHTVLTDDAAKERAHRNQYPSLDQAGNTIIDAVLDMAEFEDPDDEWVAEKLGYIRTGINMALLVLKEYAEVLDVEAQLPYFPLDTD